MDEGDVMQICRRWFLSTMGVLMASVTNIVEAEVVDLDSHGTKASASGARNSADQCCTYCKILPGRTDPVQVTLVNGEPICDDCRYFLGSPE